MRTLPATHTSQRRGHSLRRPATQKREAATWASLGRQVIDGAVAVVVAAVARLGARRRRLGRGVL